MNRLHARAERYWTGGLLVLLAAWLVAGHAPAATCQAQETPPPSDEEEADADATEESEAVDDVPPDAEEGEPAEAEETDASAAETTESAADSDRPPAEDETGGEAGADDVPPDAAPEDVGTNVDEVEPGPTADQPVEDEGAPPGPPADERAQADDVPPDEPMPAGDQGGPRPPAKLPRPQPRGPDTQAVPPSAASAAAKAAQDRAEARRKLIEDREARRNARRQEGETAPPPEDTAEPPATPPARHPGLPGRAAKGAQRPAGPTTKAAQPETVVDVDIEEPDFTIPPEEREYQFSFEEAPYADLLDSFSRMSGLAVVGDPPQGKVTFKTTEVMDFKTALKRIRFLLFRNADPYWMQRKGNILEVTRVTELPRNLELEDMYPNEAQFRAADRDEDDLVILLYSPEKGAASDLMIIRDYLPDYVRMAPLDDPTQNRLSIFGLVKDVNKFLDLVGIFFDTEDPRVFKEIPVRHVTPSQVAEDLTDLMDLGAGGAAARLPRGREAPAGVAATREVKLLPDDPRKVILVRALPSDIEEIERILPFIDVPPPADFNPVIIPLRHRTTAEVMEGLTPLLNAVAQPAPAQPPAQPQPRPSRRTKTSSTRTPTVLPGVASTDDATVVPEPRNNRLIVLGSEEGVARVRQIVELLDVPGDWDKPTIIALKHIDAIETAQKLTQVMSQVRPPTGAGGATFAVTPEVPTKSLLIVAGTLELQLARELVAGWDVPNAVPTLHKYRLEWADPEDVAVWLFRLESGQPQAAAPAPQAPPTERGRKAPTRRSTPSRAAAAPSGKFFGDPVRGMVYVVCTDQEWENVYLPKITELDEDAKPDPLAKHLVTLAAADPQTVINTVTQVLGGEGGDMPQMVPVTDGFWIIDASAEEISEIESLVAAVDVDPSAETETRVFEIKYADPEKVRQDVTALLSSVPTRRASEPQPAPSGPSPEGKQRPKTPRRAATASPAPNDEVKMVAAADRLVVTAPVERMEEIAELVALMDVDTEVETDLRVYPLPPGVNVDNLAETLTRLTQGSTVPAAGGEGKPRGKARRPTAPGAPSDITIISQPAAQRLVVSAPLDEFERIEELIKLLGTPEEEVETVYEFIAVEPGTAATMVELIEPMLQAKLTTFLANGTIPQPEGAPKGGPQQPQGLLTIQADPMGDRIVMAAPPALVGEARTLVEQLNRPVEDEERVIRTVLLDKSNAEEMAAVIQARLANEQPRLQQPVRRGRKGEPASPPMPVQTAGGDLDVIVTPAPGGGALVLSGPAADVDTVEGWINQIEADLLSSNKIIKMYELGDANAEQVVDTLMAVVDSGQSGRRAPQAPKKTEKEEEGSFLDIDWFEELSTQITRQGTDLYISANSYAGTMLVAATPTKMREVDELMKKFLGDAETGLPPIIPPAPPGPVPLLYELKYTDPYDAVYVLEEYLDLLWMHEEKPSVDYSSFTNTLVIKGDPAHYDEVKKIIEDWVDKPKEGFDKKQSFATIQGTGMTAKEAAKLLEAQLLSNGVDVEIIPLSPEDEGEGLEEILPCVPPASALAEVRAAAALGQAAGDRQATSAPAPSPSAEPPASGGAETDSGGEPRPPNVRILYDDKTGRLALEGSAAAIDAIEETLKSIKDEFEKAPAPPTIRIFRLKYVSVSKAADILDQMFNDRQRRAQEARMVQLQQQLRRQQQMQRQPRGQEGQQQGDQPEQRGERGARGQDVPGAPGQETPEAQQQLELTVNVYPNPRDRTLIIRAANEAFPAVVDLLRKIDKPSQKPMDYKIFTLVNLVAADVEEKLKAMLGQTGQRTTRTRSSPSRRPGQPAGVPQFVEGDMLQMEFEGGEGSAIAAEEITITSDDRTNSVLVMAPQEAMELVERFINDMEALASPLENVDYVLAHADATQVARTLQGIFAEKGPGGAQGAAAANLVNIVGDADSNIVFVAAPAALQAQIKTLIDKIDGQAAEELEPRVIPVALGRPTDIARKIEEVLAGAGRGKGKQSRIKITGDDASKQLLVFAPEEMVPQIESLVSKLDQPTSIDIRIYPLEHAQATEVLQGLNEMVRQALSQLHAANVSTDMFSATADDRSNSLVVMGGPMTFMLVEKVLKDIDVPPRAPMEVVTAVYQLANASAAEVGRNINAVYGNRREKGGEPPRAEANPSGNILLVHGPKVLVDEIYQQVIKPLEDTFAVQIHQVYELENGRAADVANVVNQTLNAASRRTGGGQTPVTVVANEPLNCLVVSGTQKDYDAIAPLIQQLDRKPEEMTGLVIEVYQLRYADPGSTIGTITSSFPRLPGQKPEDVVRASYAWGTSALVVAASPDNQIKVKELLDKVDIESTAGREVHIVELKFANADELARKLGEVYSRSRRQQRDEQPISFTAEPGTNSLLVYASEVEMQEIAPMVASLDVEPEFEQDRLFKSFQLTYAECWEVKGLIDETFRAQGGRSFNPRDTVTTMAAAASNSIVVSASPQRMEQIEELILEVDKKDAAMRDVRMLSVKHADPAAVQRSLHDVFAQAGAGRRGQTIFISNPPGSDVLLIKANDKEFAEIQQIVEQIDTTEAEVGGEIRVVPLKFTDAAETQEILQEYLRKPGGGRGADLAGDVRVSAATATNSLVISGDAGEIEHLVGVIGQIDVEVEDATNAPRIIPLQYAQASELEPALTSLFAEQRGSRGPRGTTTMPPVIVANDGGNVLIVRASAVDFKQIERLVAEMDTEEAGVTSEMKILPLKVGVDAEELAAKLDDILEQQLRAMDTRGRGSTQPQRVLVFADARSNSLILSGPQSKFADIERLVSDLQDLGPAGGTVSAVIRLKNIDPEEAQQLIDQVVQESKGGTSGGGRRSGGGDRRRR